MNYNVVVAASERQSFKIEISHFVSSAVQNEAQRLEERLGMPYFCRRQQQGAYHQLLQELHLRDFEVPVASFFCYSGSNSIKEGHDSLVTSVKTVLFRFDPLG